MHGSHHCSLQISQSLAQHNKSTNSLSTISKPVVTHVIGCYTIAEGATWRYWHVYRASFGICYCLPSRLDLHTVATPAILSLGILKPVDIIHNNTSYYSSQ
ncbi:hypothetical protein J1614_007731 [Plenodomus biglobosus]|nr:hypothetical protein J1614_007731 [Plenodomus biglobosus]